MSKLTHLVTANVADTQCAHCRICGGAHMAHTSQWTVPCIVTLRHDCTHRRSATYRQLYISLPEYPFHGAISISCFSLSGEMAPSCQQSRMILILQVWCFQATDCCQGPSHFRHYSVKLTTRPVHFKVYSHLSHTLNDILIMNIDIMYFLDSVIT